MKWFFTADEHYFHENVIEFCNRPFNNLDEMHKELISRHNRVVKKPDFVIHIGDFSFGGKEKTEKIIKQLYGNHIFLKGSHDKWLKNANQIWERKIDNRYIVCCHYCLKIWPRSHYGSWHLFAHSHGKLQGEGKSVDIGVDTNDYYPYSFEQIVEIMDSKPDNFNLVKNIFS